MSNFRRLVAASLEGLVTMGVIECRWRKHLDCHTILNICDCHINFVDFIVQTFQNMFYFRHDQELCAEFNHTDGELGRFYQTF